jgi:hypothetical protein
LDSEQSTVATLVNPENNAYITLAINSSQGANCSIQQVAITNENTL